MLLVALRCPGPAPFNGDWAIRTRHFKLQVNIARSCHEPSVSRSAQDGVIRALKIYHLKGDDLRAEIFSVSKGCLQVDLAYRSCRLAWDYSMENSLGLLQLFLSQSRSAESLIIQDVDAASSIHEHIVKCISSNPWGDYQSQSPRVLYH